MFSQTSRYKDLEVVSFIDTQPDGTTREVRHVVPRTLPPLPRTLPPRAFLVAAEDRLDRVAAALYADPTQYWRLCDVNPVTRPTELTDKVGEAIAVWIPGT
jgi:hypothetical protein